MPTFDRYSRGAVARARPPWVTLQRRGVISVNCSAYHLLNRPNAVALMYDPAREVIGLERTSIDHADACYLRSPSGKASGPFVFSALTFLKYHGVAVDASRRWEAFLENGSILCIDLRTAGVAVTSNRAKVAVASGS